MNTDRNGFHTCKEYHKTESLWNHTTSHHKEGEYLEDLRIVGASSCNCRDGTDQRVQSLMFMMMITISRILGFTDILDVWIRLWKMYTLLTSVSPTQVVISRVKIRACFRFSKLVSFKSVSPYILSVPDWLNCYISLFPNRSKSQNLE